MLWTSPAWRRAPLLLLAFPSLLLAMAVAFVTLSVASAAGPAFVSSAGNEVLAEGIGGISCPWEVPFQAGGFGGLFGTTFLSNGTQEPAAKLSRDRQSLIAGAVKGIRSLTPLVTTVVTDTMLLSPLRGPMQESVRVATRTGFTSHISPVSSTGGEGVWVPDTSAARLHLRLGGMVRLDSGNGTTNVRVAGIYRDMTVVGHSSFWCTQGFLFHTMSQNFPPPPLVLADRTVLDRLARPLGIFDAAFSWEFALRPSRVTLPQAEALAARLSGAAEHVSSQATVNGLDLDASTQFPDVVDRAAQTVNGLRGSVDTVALAGRVVALLVIGVAAMYWIQRRRTEVGLLRAKGVGPPIIATKVVLEALPVAVAGAVAGWLLSIWLVKRLGPTSVLDNSAIASALEQVGLSTGLALGTMGVVAAFSARQLSETKQGPLARGREALARAPWELIVLALAAASFYEIITRGTAPIQSSSGPPTGARVDALLLLFPILFIAGVAGLVSRGLRHVLPWLRSAGTAAPPALYLTTRRLAGASRVALAFITASALAIGILAYSGTVAASMSATSTAKAELSIGSDVAVTLGENSPVPRGLSLATKVLTTQNGPVVFSPDVGAVQVVAVDRGTFARVAFWEPGFGDRPLGDLLKQIAPARSGAPIPVLAAGTKFPPAGQLVVSGARTASVFTPVKVVGTLRSFPGEPQSVPIVVMDQGTAIAMGLPTVAEIWAKGDPPAILRTMRAAGLPVLIVSSASDVERDPQFLSLSWTFRFLKGLGILAGLIAVGGVLLYLDARQRAREVSYALARRMGLSRRAHLLSVALEVAGMMVVAFGVGAIMAGVAARMVNSKVDPLPNLPPSPYFRLPLGLLAVTGLLLLMVSSAGAWWVQRTADRARVSEVMRIAG